MKTYWDEFMDRYGIACTGMPLVKILEAFWYCSNGREDETLNLIVKSVHIIKGKEDENKDT